jgi:hypothetical protein
MPRPPPDHAQTIIAANANNSTDDLSACSEEDAADFMAYRSAYHDDDNDDDDDDLDADDEFEHTIHTDPALPPDDFSPTDSEGMTSPEHTPTTYSHSYSAHSSPTGLVSEWTAEQCADWVANIGLSQYAASFVGEHSLSEPMDRSPC